MVMTIGGFSENKQHSPMADINVTPMVDVMLVLLVIFIITAPLFTSAIKIDLPGAKAPRIQEKPEMILLSINAKGAIFWNNDEVQKKDLEAKLAAAAQKMPLPELHLRADKATHYEVIAQVMSAAQSSGLIKIGFVTDPSKD
jgi:biopolymer transport protein ExbD